MGTVTISFLGACTIFRDLPSLAPPDLPPGTELPANRVVLARTTESFTQITGVDPHIAKMQLDADIEILSGPSLPPAVPPFAKTFSLDGVGLKIRNALDTTLPADRGLDCLPSLAEFLRGELGKPTLSVFVPDSASVQAWFDVAGGDWNAYKMRTDPPCDTIPSISYLIIQTEGDPELVFTPWDPAIEPTTVRLTNGSSGTPNIDVMNFALGEGVVDDNRDFILNYTLTDPFPWVADIDIPQALACRFFSPGTYTLPRCGDAGPGCSNSVYP
jgi:hypothetical protein